MFADRFSRHAIKLGKNIQSDHDILQKELIVPVKSGDDSSHHDDLKTDDPMLEDKQQLQSRQGPSVQQLIEYKQHIQMENNRRLHRENLAKMAETRRNEEQILTTNTPVNGDGVPEGGFKPENGIGSSRTVPDKRNVKPLQKPVATSREEEELLNEETHFGSGKRRLTERNRSKVTAVGANVAYLTRGMTNRRLSTMKPLVCKVCGNVMESEANQSLTDFEQTQGKPNDSCYYSTKVFIRWESLYFRS